MLRNPSRTRRRAVVLVLGALAPLVAQVAPAVAAPSATAAAVVDTLAKPKLRVTEVRLLNRKVSTIGLVRGVWTTLNVRVANTGTVPATGTKLVGSGRGVKVKAVKVGKVYDGSNSLARIKVKLTAKNKRTKLRLVASSGTVRAARVVKVKRLAAPKRPKNGRYKSDDAQTTFRIKKGRVVDFRSRQMTRCGGYPDPFTYHWATYDFPRTPIARNGLVDARQKHRLFTAGLQMKVSGKRITQGYFFYSGPNRCWASKAIKVRRVGK